MQEKETSLILQGTLASGEVIAVQLPPEALDNLQKGVRWRGLVVASLAATTRHGAIAAQITEKRKFVNVVRATLPQRKVIRAWNRSRFIRSLEAAQDRETRNYPLPFKKIKEHLPLVQKALNKVGYESIIRSMESYFDFCSTGEHIWDGRNHGFKSLNGFLEKLVALQKSKERPWWDVKETAIRAVQDDNVRLTHRIANSFAQTFMDEEQYPLEEGSKQHLNFVKAAARLVSYSNRLRRKGIELNQGQLIGYLLAFIQSIYDRSDDCIYPGHLSSDAIWTALPQYLQEKGVI